MGHGRRWVSFFRRATGSGAGFKSRDLSRQQPQYEACLTCRVWSATMVQSESSTNVDWVSIWRGNRSPNSEAVEKCVWACRSPFPLPRREEKGDWALPGQPEEEITDSDCEKEAAKASEGGESVDGGKQQQAKVGKQKSRDVGDNTSQRAAGGCNKQNDQPLANRHTAPSRQEKITAPPGSRAPGRCPPTVEFGACLRKRARPSHAKAGPPSEVCMMCRENFMALPGSRKRSGWESPNSSGDDATKPWSIWEPLIVSFEDCISLFFIPFPCSSDVEKTGRGAPATAVSTRFRGVLWP